MTETQLFTVALTAVPMIVILIGILINNARLSRIETGLGMNRP